MTKKRPNPARDLVEFATQLVEYENPNDNMSGFFTKRHGLSDPRIDELMTKMSIDLSLPGKAARAARATLGDNSSSYMQWRMAFSNAFSAVSLNAPVSSVTAHIQGEPIVHLRYCGNRLDELEVSEDLQELLDAIQSLREDVASLTLAKPIEKQVDDSLGYLENVVWDRLYGVKSSGETVAGTVIKNVGELRRKRLPKNGAKLIKELARLAIVVCYPEFSSELLEAGSRVADALLPASDSGAP